MPTNVRVTLLKKNPKCLLVRTKLYGTTTRKYMLMLHIEVVIWNMTTLIYKSLNIITGKSCYYEKVSPRNDTTGNKNKILRSDYNSPRDLFFLNKYHVGVSLVNKFTQQSYQVQVTNVFLCLSLWNYYILNDN